MLKLIVYTFMGSNFAIFIFGFLMGVNSERNEFASDSYYKDKPLIERSALLREGNRKTRILFSSLKVTEKYGGVSYI